MSSEQEEKGDEEKSPEEASGGDEAKKKEGGDDEEQEELPMTDVTDPQETDVLCGRGGAALRHPGNQTYRRLVNLNKGLYITCLKTEKLKISRSIVSAIREQNGRFLERDAKKGTWYDIGDKKAIEKTSQALREGQPKLRQKMIERGEIPPDQQTSMEHQFGNGVYDTNSGKISATDISDLGVLNDNGDGLGGMSSMTSNNSNMNQMPPPQMHQGSSMQSSMSGDMPPPPSRMLSNMDNMTPDVMIQRLSLNSINPNQIPSWTPSLASAMEDSRSSFRSRMRPSLTQHGSGVASELGLPSTQNLSYMSDFSAYGQTSMAMQMQDGGGSGVHRFDSLAGMDQPSLNMMMNSLQSQFSQGSQGTNQNIPITGNNLFNNSNVFSSNNGIGGGGMGSSSGRSGAAAPPPPPPDISPMMASPSISSGFDRRNFLKKMKYRPPNQRNPNSQRSMGDDMPDIHMVDSQFSLTSNLSGGAGGSRHQSTTAGAGGGFSGDNRIPSFTDHSMKDSDTLGVGSRRSLMSGLSKISDTSDLQSVFSDMGRKFGTSNRSIAMSEISGFDEGFDLQQTFEIDPVPQTAKLGGSRHQK